MVYIHQTEKDSTGISLKSLDQNYVTSEQLETIADEVAGVSRNGIQALQQAALQTEEPQHDQVADRDVSNPFKRARRYIRELNLEILPFHHQLLYELVRMCDRLEVGKLNDQHDYIAGRAYRGGEQTPVL